MKPSVLTLATIFSLSAGPALAQETTQDLNAATLEALQAKEAEQAEPADALVDAAVALKDAADAVETERDTQADTAAAQNAANETDAALLEADQKLSEAEDTIEASGDTETKKEISDAIESVENAMIDTQEATDTPAEPGVTAEAEVEIESAITSTETALDAVQTPNSNEAESSAEPEEARRQIKFLKRRVVVSNDGEESVEVTEKTVSHDNVDEIISEIESASHDSNTASSASDGQLVVKIIKTDAASGETVHITTSGKSVSETKVSEENTHIIRVTPADESGDTIITITKE